ncbi:hypothetical protein Isop_2971 [Isosphaera pallida ATCC 43644]|jgi:hypothetical protein|uniref:Uncharacterized protein n=1 Tax=Isosphaera pallida (strain ATCC 43644 / DSM 9630 / IS1B) TaxID=575540 RepID=E8R2A6_ISOPI|nr:hypothetical protein [Isosphaera pallida]ADV63536.1 hypothetical protein Isop_2971 [Isosphaera pallida ATCC 43644]
MVDPATISPYLFLPPLVVAISLVYAATRHETWKRILPHAIRLAGTIFIIMIVSTAVLLFINTRI